MKEQNKNLFKNLFKDSGERLRKCKRLVTKGQHIKNCTKHLQRFRLNVTPMFPAMKRKNRMMNFFKNFTFSEKRQQEFHNRMKNCLKNCYVITVNTNLCTNLIVTITMCIVRKTFFSGLPYIIFSNKSVSGGNIMAFCIKKVDWNPPVARWSLVHEYKLCLDLLVDGTTQA
jgi:hypothetical protein